MKLIIFLSLFFYFEFCSTTEDRPQINTPLGVIRGIYLNATNGKRYEAFQGIPFAKPPVKKYRFREPRPMGKWNGILEARYVYTCVQYNHETNSTIGEEDCLYLNVYTPDHKPINLYDVIVFIHGGAFMYDAGHSCKETSLMKRNVVYVSFNYRLGPFGFLSTEDSIVPGNNGMKDQVIAMKWIKNNIIYFGGNPNSITLTGMSAGGASVHLHYMSPLSKGLFNRGISISGTALNPWVLQEGALDKVKKLASLVQCDLMGNNNNNNVKEMVHCLSYIPAKCIGDATGRMYEFLHYPLAPFSVVVEPVGTPNAFLPSHPYVVMKTKNVQNLPWITSVTKYEGLYPAAELYPRDNLEKFASRWSELAPIVLELNYTNPNSDHSLLIEQIREYYLNDKPINKETFMNLIKMFGDRLFISNSQMAAKLQANVNTEPVYYYLFTYRGAQSNSQKLAETNKDFGSVHSDDIVFILHNDVDMSTIKSDRDMTDVLIDLWTNYAATSEPKYLNADWQPVSKNINDPLNYIEIKSPVSVERYSKDFDNVDYWLNIPLKENQHLFPNIKDEL